MKQAAWIYFLLGAFLLFTGCGQTTRYPETIAGEPGAPGVDGRDGVDGTDGVDGIDGTPGLNAPVRIYISRPATFEECPYGGTTVDTFLDLNGNETFEEGTDRNFVPIPSCNGAPGVCEPERDKGKDDKRRNP
jgi:hypothetical protein